MKLPRHELARVNPLRVFPARPGITHGTATTRATADGPTVDRPTAGPTSKPAQANSAEPM